MMVNAEDLWRDKIDKNTSDKGKQDLSEYVDIGEEDEDSEWESENEEDRAEDWE